MKLSILINLNHLNMSNQMASYSKSRVAKLITIVFVMLSANVVFSQSPITAYVISSTVNVRTGPSVIEVVGFGWTKLV